MSKIISLLGANNATNVKVQQAVGYLGFHLAMAGSVFNVFSTEVLPKLNSIKVNVDLQSKTLGTLTLIPKVPLGVLAEICASMGGQIDVINAPGVAHIRFKFPIGSGGALQLSDESTIVIDITGTAVGDTLDVYAMDLPISSAIANVIGTLRFNANSAQSLNLLSAQSIHLPVASFEKIEITYRGGKVVTLLPEEIKAWVLEGNETQGNLNGAVTSGYLDHYNLAVTDAVSAKVTLNADVNAYISTLAQAN